MAFKSEPCASTTAPIRPSTISEKYSAGPNLSASADSGSDTAATSTVAHVPAKNDLLRVQGDGYSVTVEDSTLKASTRTPDQDGVKGWNFTLRRVDISDVVDPVHIHGDNVLVENSRLHDNAHFLEDPNWGGTPSHSDSIQPWTSSRWSAG